MAFSLVLSLTGFCKDEIKEPAQPLIVLGSTAFAGFGAALSNQSPPIVASELGTSGSVETIRALQAGDADVGPVQSDLAYLAYTGALDQMPQPHTNLRAIALMHTNVVVIAVPMDSNVRHITELRGKRIGMSGQGSASERAAQLILAGHGLSMSDVEPVIAGATTMVTKFKELRLDAAIIAHSPSVREFLVDRASVQQSPLSFRLLPVRKSVVSELRAKNPFVKPLVVPAGTLPGQREDTETIGVDDLLVCRKDLSDDLVYRVTKAYFSRSHVSDSPDTFSVDPEFAPATPIPLHSGAARYDREQELFR